MDVANIDNNFFISTKRILAFCKQKQNLYIFLFHVLVTMTDTNIFCRCLHLKCN